MDSQLDDRLLVSIQAFLTCTQVDGVLTPCSTFVADIISFILTKDMFRQSHGCHRWSKLGNQIVQAASHRTSLEEVWNITWRISKLLSWCDIWIAYEVFPSAPMSSKKLGLSLWNSMHHPPHHWYLFHQKNVTDTACISVDIPMPFPPHKYRGLPDDPSLSNHPRIYLLTCIEDTSWWPRSILGGWYEEVSGKLFQAEALVPPDAFWDGKRTAVGIVGQEGGHPSVSWAVTTLSWSFRDSSLTYR
jgi:hypothetical protein